LVQAAQESSGFDAEPQRGVSERNRAKPGSWREDIPPSPPNKTDRQCLSVLFSSASFKRSAAVAALPFFIEYES